MHWQELLQKVTHKGGTRGESTESSSQDGNIQVAN